MPESWFGGQRESMSNQVRACKLSGQSRTDNYSVLYYYPAAFVSEEKSIS